MILSRSSHVAVPEGVVMQDISGESVILNLHTENYFGLDEVGTDIWKALINTGTIGEAVDSLLKMYDVDAQTLIEDIDGLVTKLIDHGLVEISDD